jgi:hypothetical protein
MMLAMLVTEHTCKPVMLAMLVTEQYCTVRQFFRQKIGKFTGLKQPEINQYYPI